MKYIRSKKGIRTLVLFSIVAVFTLVLASPVAAGEIISDGPVARVAEDEVIDDDLFISGPTVEMLGTVKGDVFATGQNIIVRGVIEGNLFVAGQAIIVGGEVDGSAHLAGFAIQFEPTAAITRNAYCGGFSVASASGSQIARSLYSGSYQVLLDGDVVRDVTAGAVAVKVNGMIGGDAKVEVEIPPEGETPDPVNQAWMPMLPPGMSRPSVAPGADIPRENVAGEYDVKVTVAEAPMPAEKIQPPSPGMVLLNKLRQRAGETVALLLVGILVITYASGALEETVEQVRQKWLASLGWGAVVFILLIPAVLIALFLLIFIVLLLSVITLGQLTSIAMTLSWLTFSGSLTTFIIIAWLLARIMIAYLVGYELLKLTSPATLEGRWGKFWSLLIGVVLYELIMLIPIGGTLVTIFVILLGVGAIFVLLWKAYQAQRTATA